MGGEAVAEPGGDAACLRTAVGGVADVFDGAEDALEVEWGEAEYAAAQFLLVDAAVDLACTDGADVTESLGEDQVGRDRGEEGDVDLVGGAARGEVGAEVGVDLGRGAAVRGDGGAGEDGQGSDLRRIVAFVGDGDQLRLEPKGTGDFGGAGQEGGDSHGAEDRGSAAGPGKGGTPVKGL